MTVAGLQFSCCQTLCEVNVAIMVEKALWTEPTEPVPAHIRALIENISLTRKQSLSGYYRNGNRQSFAWASEDLTGAQHGEAGNLP